MSTERRAITSCLLADLRPWCSESHFRFFVLRQGLTGEAWGPLDGNLTQLEQSIANAWVASVPFRNYVLCSVDQSFQFGERSEVCAFFCHPSIRLSMDEPETRPRNCSRKKRTGELSTVTHKDLTEKLLNGRQQECENLNENSNDYLGRVSSP